MERLPEFIAENLILVAAFVGLTIAVVISFVGRYTRGYREVTPAELTMLMNRENALVVDLSAQNEFEKAHIPGSRHVALSQFDPENKDLVKVKEKPVVLVCRNGMTSGQQARRLVKAGFTRPHVLGGGVFEWQKAELPLIAGRA